jgi:hypothetical protein
MDEPIEDYLDELYVRLHGDPRRARRVLDEAADHLRESAARLVDTGLAPLAAEREAVRAFGRAEPLVASVRRAGWRTLAAESLRTVLMLAAIGLAAVGLSGAVAAGMNAAIGTWFVGHLPPNASVSCFPGPVPCRVGSVGETAQDAVTLRVVAGLVGVVLLVALRFVGRRHRAARLLPPATTELLAGAAFGAATLALVAASVPLLTDNGGAGAGFYLSGAVVAAAAAVGYLVRAARVLLER